MTTEKQELMETRLKILLAQFALYLADDTGRENDNHEYWINGFIKLYTNELQAAVQKARTEVAEEIVKKLQHLKDEAILKAGSGRMLPNIRVAKLYGELMSPDYQILNKLEAMLKAKYLFPTQQKDTLLCGCPRLDRFSMCIKQEHCKEKVQNKINTGSIDTEDKSKERK